MMGDSFMKIGICLFLFGLIQAQINIPGTAKTTFYLDSASDCNGRPREVGQSTVSVFGKSGAPQGSAVTSCTVTFSTDNVREPYRFKIQFLAVTIRDQNVNFYVYDGQFDGRLRWAFSSANQKPSNLQFDFTTGQLVTFRLTRGEQDTDYDIRVVVTPVKSDVGRCQYGSNDYDCDEYGYIYRPLGTKEIVGIVGGAFAFVLIIVIIVVVCCYRKQRGISQKWKEQKLGQVNTAASIHSLNGKASTAAANSSSRPWTSESSKQGFASIRRSPNLPRAKISRSFRTNDGESTVFGSNASIPVKRPLPPPAVDRNPRGTSSRSRSRDRFFRDRDDRYSDDSYTTENNFSERNFKPPTYREALRHDNSESSADEHSFVQANDSHPQSVFVEREIAPRSKPQKIVNSKSQGSGPNHQPSTSTLPPPEEDMTYDSIEPKKKERKALLEKKKQEESEEEEMEESDTENESEEEEEDSEEEESEEEEEEDEDEDQADPSVVYSKPDRSKSLNNKPVEQAPPSKSAFVPAAGSQPPQQFPGAPYPGYFPPGVHHPQPRYGYPAQAPPYQPHSHPQAPPYQKAPPPSQPSSYHQANFTVPLQPSVPPTRNQNNNQPRDHHPSQRSGHSRPQHASASNPNNPPIYSYLVSRGYQPVDGRYSPVSTSTGGSNLSRDRITQNDESDFSANLDSGVELLKRKN